jgi:hypothetical protein
MTRKENVVKYITPEGTCEIDLSNEQESNLFFERLQQLLTMQTLTVTFTKKDGTERVMRCTLDPAKLPIREHTETKIRKPNNEILSVFDLDAQGWRSFTKTAVKCIDYRNIA